MQTRIRDVRKALKLTLAEVAARCTPPTTAQTIGRLETGMRTVSIGWLNRIAAALGVNPEDLVSHAARSDVPVIAVLHARGTESPRRLLRLAAPQPGTDMIGMTVDETVGEYRRGDQLWLERLQGADRPRGLSHDCLVPLADGAFTFGRLVSADPAQGFALLPATGGALIGGLMPDWIGVQRLLIRHSGN